MPEKVKLEDAVEKAIAAREQSKKTQPHEREEHILKFLNALIDGLEEVNLK